MRIIFDHSEEEASNISTFYFKPDSPVSYTAGQFIELKLEHKNPDNRGQHRWFTLSSSPSDELLSITTKFVDKDGSTFKKALRKLKPGDELNVSDPMGDFVLPKLIQTPLIFVAGGIGITPFHSILTWLAAKKEERPITMLYGVGNEDEIIFQDTFDKASQHVSIIVNEPSDTWGGERGLLGAELITGIGDMADDTLIYLSGPEPMTEKIHDQLIHAGINRSQLVLDSFPNYSINY